MVFIDIPLLLFRFEKSLRLRRKSLNNDKLTIGAKLWINKELEKQTNEERKMDNQQNRDKIRDITQ